MKLSLVVLTEGKTSGKAIPIKLAQFIIGRDPQCQLRPSSALISKRHCAVITRAGKCFVRDFDSTNGTFVNEEPVKGEREIHDADTLRVGPLAFRVALEGGGVPVDKQTPLPKPAAARRDENDDADDSVASMLLDLADDSSPPNKDEAGVPEGSTVMEGAALPPEQAAAGKPDEAAAKSAKPAEKKKGFGDTSAAAEALLQKYMRRQRS